MKAERCEYDVSRPKLFCSALNMSISDFPVRDSRQRSVFQQVDESPFMSLTSIVSFQVAFLRFFSVEAMSHARGSGLLAVVPDPLITKLVDGDEESSLIVDGSNQRSIASVKGMAFNR